MKCRDIYNVIINKNTGNPSKVYTKIKPMIGLDTETEKGKCFVLGYFGDNIDNVVYDVDFFDVLFNKRFRNSFNFFYNITYDFQAIIKYLPTRNLKELVKWDKTIYNNKKIEVLPGKMFSITDGHKSSRFYDLAQFFNHNKLNTSAEKFLGMNKIDLQDEGIDIKKLSYKKYIKDINYRYTLNKYLRRDCEITKKLGDKLYTLISPYVKPCNWYSQATFSEQYFLEHLNKSLNLPSLNILDFALRAYQGGRFEVFKRGYFDKGYVSDIKSAYPYHNIQVCDVSKKEWIVDNCYRSDAQISLFNIDVEIHDISISPLKYHITDKSGLIYPIGKFKDIYVNKKEYELVEKLGFKIKIHKAYHYIDNEPTYPYTFLEEFYELKEKYKRETQKELNWIPKIIMNGFYGKTIQLTPTFIFKKEYEGDKDLYDMIEIKNKLIYVYRKFKAGKIFNPVVANEITANTRVQLFESVINKLDDVVGFQTDSIITSKKLPLNYDDKLGSWELENQGRLLILGSGIYQLLDKDNNTTKIRMRGFQKDIDLFSMLNKNKDNDKIKLNLTRNYKLKQIYRLKFDDAKKNELLNQIVDAERVIDINFDKKRVWDRPFKNCNDVLNNIIASKPLSI